MSQQPQDVGMPPSGSPAGSPMGGPMPGTPGPTPQGTQPENTAVLPKPDWDDVKETE